MCCVRPQMGRCWTFSMQTSVILLHNTGLWNSNFISRDSISVALCTLKYVQVYQVDKSSEMSVLWNNAVYLRISQQLSLFFFSFFPQHVEFLGGWIRLSLRGPCYAWEESDRQSLVIPSSPDSPPHLPALLRQTITVQIGERMRGCSLVQCEAAIRRNWKRCRLQKESNFYCGRKASS